MTLTQEVAQEFALDVLEFTDELSDFTLTATAPSPDEGEWVFSAEAPSHNPLDGAFILVTDGYDFRITQVPEAEWLDWPPRSLIALTAGSVNQPRAPKGSPNGGQWVKSGGGGGAFTVPHVQPWTAVQEDTLAHLDTDGEEGPGEFLSGRDEQILFPFSIGRDTPELLDAMTSYTQGAVAQSVNAGWRGEKSLGPSDRLYSEALDEAFDISITGRDVTLYRDTGLAAFDYRPDMEGLVGTVWSDEGYLSTSLSPTAFSKQVEAHRWPSAEARMVIKVPEETPALYLEHESLWPGQFEVLLPRNTPLAITRVQLEEDGVYRIEATVATPVEQVQSKPALAASAGAKGSSLPPLAQDQVFKQVGHVSSLTASAVISETFYSPTQPRHPKGSPSGGQFAKGGGGGRSHSALIAGLAKAAMEGGFTYDTSLGSQPTSGHVVALRGRSSIKPAKNKTEAAQQIKEFLSQPDPPSHVVGGWHDKEHNEIVLDYVDVIKDRAEAIRVGRERNQQAIFDLNTLTEIDTGGTGDRETGGAVEESPDG